MLSCMIQTLTPTASSAADWCAQVQTQMMVALDAAWRLAERSDDPTVIARARERAKLCGQFAATARKIAAMIPAPKADKLVKSAKAENPLDIIEDFVDRMDTASKPSTPSQAKPPAAQAVAMRAALQKLGRR